MNSVIDIAAKIIKIILYFLVVFDLVIGSLMIIIFLLLLGIL